MTEHDPAVMNVDGMGGLLGQPESGCGAGLHHRHPCLLSVQGAAFQAGANSSMAAISPANASPPLKQRGIRAIARFSPDLNWRDALEATPNGSSATSTAIRLPARKSRELYRDLHLHHLYDRAHARHHARGEQPLSGRWPSSPMPGRRSGGCRNATAPPARTCRTYDTPDYWDKFTERVADLWKMWDGIAKEKSPDNLYFGNMGGAIASGAEHEVAAEARLLVQLRQSGPRRRLEPDLGLHSLQGRVCDAIMNGHTATNVTGFLLHRRLPLAQHPQVHRRSADVDERDRRQRHGALVPLHRRRRRAWAPTAAGSSRAASISTGWRSTIRISPTKAPSPTWRW